MQFSYTTLLAVLAATATAQVSLPSCADACVGDSYGGCSKLDISCICNNKDYIASLSCCVAKTCTTAEQDQTIQFADSICKGVGVTDLPTSASCSTTAASTGSGSSSTSASASGSSSMSMTSMSSSSSSSTSLTQTAPGNPTSSLPVPTGSTSIAGSSSSQGPAATNKVEKVGIAMVIAGAIAVL